MKMKQKRAFTLVELLVVIGIIGLLISILLPALNKAQEAGRKTQCLAGMKSIMTAVLMYSADNKFLPKIPGPNDLYNPSASNAFSMYMLTPNWSGKLDYEHGSLLEFMAKGAAVREKMWTCPSDGTPGSRALAQVGGGDAIIYTDRNFSFTFNDQIHSTFNGGPLVTRITQIKNPTHKILLQEEVAPNDLNCQMELQDHDQPAFRHSGWGDFGFADGHVESLRPDQLGLIPPSKENQKTTWKTNPDGHIAMRTYTHLTD